MQLFVSYLVNNTSHVEWREKGKQKHENRFFLEVSDSLDDQPDPDGLRVGHLNEGKVIADCCWVEILEINLR